MVFMAGMLGVRAFTVTTLPIVPFSKSRRVTRPHDAEVGGALAMHVSITLVSRGSPRIRGQRWQVSWSLLLGWHWLGSSPERGEAPSHSLCTALSRPVSDGASQV